MDALLATQSMTPDSSGNLPGLGGDVQLKQIDSGPHKAFGGMLEEAHSAVSRRGSVSLSGSPEGEQLIQQLQALPQGGKLLPLLQQVLDRAVTRGADPRQVLARMGAQLEQLGVQGEPEPAVALATVLHNLLTQNESVARQRLVAEQGNGVAARALELRAELAPGSAAQGRPAFGAGTAEHMQLNEILRENGSSGSDKSMLQSQQTVPAAQPRHPDLANVLAAARRWGGDTRAAVADSVLRPDMLAAPSAQALARTPSGALTSAHPTLNLATPFNQGGWDQALGERIQWMVSQKMQGAQIRLNPAHLGPLEVRVQVQNDQASIQFSSAHAVVRETLETALPRLREMFESSSVALLDVDISGQSFAEQQRTGSEVPVAAGNTGDSRDAEAEILLESPVAALRDSGRIDLFA